MQPDQGLPLVRPKYGAFGDTWPKGDSTSSQSRKTCQRSTSRAIHPYRPPRERSRAPMSMGERAVEEREMDHSPESMPPLEDMSHVPVLASRAGYSQQNFFFRPTPDGSRQVV